MIADNYPPLTQNQKVRLLRIARECVYHHVSRGRAPEIQESDERLNDLQGVFVSLHINDQLRGCIGTMVGDSPLYKTVSEMAVGAATRDPRFAPLRMDEVPRVDIELSILSPLRVGSIDDIEVGTHGLFITQGRTRGILLPQVATQYQWSAQEFLAQTCVKAGLSRDAWKSEDCQIELFTAEVFCESGMRPGD